MKSQKFTLLPSPEMVLHVYLRKLFYGCPCHVFRLNVIDLTGLLLEKCLKMIFRLQCFHLHTTKFPGKFLQILMLCQFRKMMFAGLKAKLIWQQQRSILKPFLKIVSYATIKSSRCSRNSWRETGAKQTSDLKLSVKLYPKNDWLKAN